MRILTLCAALCALAASGAETAERPLSATLDYGGRLATVNYDESKIPPYTLEDPLSFADGRKLTDASQWPARRAEILGIFAREMYGKEPPPPETVDVRTVDEKVACGGYAIRKRFEMRFRKDGTGPCLNWILYRPRHVKSAVPVLAFLNYRGNHELTFDPDVAPCKAWVMKGPQTDGNRATEKTRGDMANPDSATYLPINAILARGYAVLSACYAEVSPDPTPACWGNTDYPQETFSYTGVFDLWPKRDPLGTGETTALGAWAWALSRAVDYAETDPALDVRRFVATGCSRLAKAALLAAARDARIPVCVPVQTGGGGCPLAKRNFGESIETEMLSFPHWYCRAYGKYEKEPWKSLTFDQHLLLASLAPRALLVLGFDDDWYDTRGEYLAVRAAAPVWRFLGAGDWTDAPYPEDFSTAAVGRNIGYARRSERHGISAWDWKTMLDFADAALACAGE